MNEHITPQQNDQQLWPQYQYTHSNKNYNYGSVKMTKNDIHNNDKMTQFLTKFYARRLRRRILSVSIPHAPQTTTHYEKLKITTQPKIQAIEDSIQLKKQSLLSHINSEKKYNGMHYEYKNKKSHMCQLTLLLNIHFISIFIYLFIYCNCIFIYNYRSSFHQTVPHFKI